MDNQHRQISGYRELSQVEIDLMNDIKALGPTLDAICSRVSDHLLAQRTANGNEPDDEKAIAESARLVAAEPDKWLQAGRDGMQACLMYLTRSVAQPTFF